ncbi:unnamed protein product [Dicrocoelium dendriticum]|nr:unnamed protein product [Dicrocoelium dendriticum]
MLGARDTQVVQVVLDGISNILSAAVENRDQVTAEIEECGGLDRIEALQEHQNVDIYRLAFDIIERFFNDGMNDEANTTAGTTGDDRCQENNLMTNDQAAFEFDAALDNNADATLLNRPGAFDF